MPQLAFLLNEEFALFRHLQPIVQEAFQGWQVRTYGNKESLSELFESQVKPDLLVMASSPKSGNLIDDKSLQGEFPEVPIALLRPDILHGRRRGSVYSIRAASVGDVKQGLESIRRQIAPAP